MAIKIKIVDKDGNYISLGRSILREAPNILNCLFIILYRFAVTTGTIASTVHMLVNFMAYFSLIDGLFILFNKKSRAVHDFLANTFVITEESYKKANADS